jgi:hypothetical protein
MKCVVFHSPVISFPTLVLFILCFCNIGMAQDTIALNGVFVGKQLTINERIKKIVKRIDSNYYCFRDTYLEVRHLAKQDHDCVVFFDGKIMKTIPNYRSTYHQLHGEFCYSKESSFFANKKIFDRWLSEDSEITEECVPWDYSYYISSVLEKLSISDFCFIKHRNLYNIEYENIDFEKFKLIFYPKKESNKSYYKGFAIINKADYAVLAAEFKNTFKYTDDGGIRNYVFEEDKIKICYKKINNHYLIDDIEISNEFNGYASKDKKIKNYKVRSYFKSIESFDCYKSMKRLDELDWYEDKTQK